jgi:phosphate transport system permease protein
MKAYKIFEKVIEVFLLFFASISVISVVFITIFILISGLPLFSEVDFFEFILSTEWNPTDDPASFGIFSFIIGSIYVTIFALIIAVPAGTGVGVFLAEMANDRWVKIIRRGIELLAGIPSVIYGLFGFFFIAPIVRDIFGHPTGLCVLTASIVLAIMILPTIINVTDVSIRAVPHEYKEGSLALGATHWQTIIRTLIPAASSGIIAGIILGIGRAIGETMAVLMVAGNAPVMPDGLLSQARTLTMNIITDLKYAEANSLHETSLFTTGIILFIFIFIINLIVQTLLKRK